MYNTKNDTQNVKKIFFVVLWNGKLLICGLEVLLVFFMSVSADEDYADDEDGCPKLEVPPNYTTKLFENKLFVVCDTTEEFTLLVCNENQWKPKYPATSSIYLPLCL